MEWAVSRPPKANKGPIEPGVLVLLLSQLSGMKKELVTCHLQRKALSAHLNLPIRKLNIFIAIAVSSSGAPAKRAPRVCAGASAPVWGRFRVPAGAQALWLHQRCLDARPGNLRHALIQTLLADRVHKELVQAVPSLLAAHEGEHHLERRLHAWQFVKAD